MPVSYRIIFKPRDFLLLTLEAENRKISLGKLLNEIIGEYIQKNKLDEKYMKVVDSGRGNESKDSRAE